ncbi:TPA: HK97 gp10 family phage protein [Enterococcus faecium]
MGDIQFESNAKEVIKQFKQMTKVAEREGIAFVNDSLNKVWETIVPITPVKSGDLRRGYRIVNARKLSTGRIVGVFVNNEKYFKYVNDGHRTRNGGFVKGRFMLQRATNLANMTYIPRRWKAMAIKVLKGVKK